MKVHSCFSTFKVFIFAFKIKVNYRKVKIVISMSKTIWKVKNSRTLHVKLKIDAPSNELSFALSFIIFGSVVAENLENSLWQAEMTKKSQV